MSGATVRTEALSNILHKTITICNAYAKGCEEKIVNEVIDSVKDLMTHLTDEQDSVKSFNEENRLSSDCLLSLLSVLSQCDTTLSNLILGLITKVGKEKSGGVLLYSLGAMDTLCYLIDGDIHAVNVIKAMSKITSHIKLNGHEAFVDGLLKELIKNVVSNDVTLKPSLCVLVNMAVSCPPIQMQLRSLDNYSLLRKTFLRLVSHDDSDISVVALAAMISTGMSDELNKLISSDKNLDQILKLPFSIILKLGSSDAFSYGIDLLVTLVNNKRVQQFLLNDCAHLDSYLAKSAALLPICDDNQLTKLFELLLALASVPTIRLMMATMVFAPVPTKEEGEQELLQHIFYLAKRSVTVDGGASVSAIKLITYIYECLSIDPSKAGSTCHLNCQFLTECLKQSELDSKINDVKLLSCEKTLASLCLLEVLCTSEPFSTGVLSEIEADTITDVIQYQLQSNPVAFNWNNKQPSGGGERLSSNLPAWSNVGISIVLRAMSVLIAATEKNDSYSTCLNDYLKKTSLLPFIATGLTNSYTENIQLSLKIISTSGTLGILQTTVLSDVLSSINNQHINTSNLRHPFQTSQINGHCLNIKSERMNGLDIKPELVDSPRGYFGAAGDGIVMSSPRGGTPRRGDPDVICSSQASQVDIAEKLGNLQVSGDSHVSDIISIYEQKLRAQKTRETHLDDLVQAKTMALSQADRLIQQYKSRLAQVDADSHKLRAIVHESERRSEGYRDKMNEMLVDRERLQSEMERLLQDSRKLEDTQRALTSVRRELDALSEIHSTLNNFTENLKHQHRELESDYSILKESERKKTVSINEKDVKISDLKKANKKFDDHVKKLTTETTGLGDQVEKLKIDNKKLEKSLKQKEEKLRVISDTLK